MAITINGKVYTGKSIVIRNGRVTIDGVAQDDALSKSVAATEIVIIGDFDRLNTDMSVNCGDVSGNISAGGSVNCDDVGGSVTAGGSVNCDDVGGSVTAGGSVR